MLTYLHKYFPILHLVRANYLKQGPACVDIELTNRCNLRCKMCWFYGENGIGDRYQSSEMSTAEIKELINQLAAYRPQIYFGGAEPFIREDFIEIMTYAKSFALPISFTTNGTLLDREKIKKIFDLGINVINFSINGPEELHDKLRGQGSFRKVISNVQYLSECKIRKKTINPLIIVNITINPLIIGQLKRTIDIIKETTGDQIDFFRIHHLWFVTPRELQAHKEGVHKTLNISAPGAKSHCIPLSQQFDSGVLSDEISKLKNTRKIIFYPDLQDKEIQAFYSDGYRLSKRCLAPFYSVVVKPNGDLKFCPDEWIDDYVLGNVCNERFETIWNNKKARYFRSIIFREKAFPACKRCSWMHCF